MMWGYGPGWAWMMIVMPIVWIGLLAVVAWAVVRVIRPQGDGYGRTHRESPQEILDRRFASGEIDGDTYTRMRAHLAGKEPGQ
jgi:putative membrane protein